MCQKNVSMTHTGSTHAPNAALGNGVPLQATMKASIDARLSWGRLAGAAAAPTRARSAAVAPHLHGCARRRRRSRGRGCTAQQVARCADAWCYEHQCHAGGACVALCRRVCAMAQAARLEPAPALQVGAGSIDSESTLERMLPKEFILVWQHQN